MKSSLRPRPLATRPTTAPSRFTRLRGTASPSGRLSGPLVGSRPTIGPVCVIVTRRLLSCRWRSEDDGLGDRPRQMRIEDPALRHARTAGGDEEQAFGLADLHPALARPRLRRHLWPYIGANVAFRPSGLEEVAALLGPDDDHHVAALAQPLVAGAALLAHVGDDRAAH